MSFANGPLGAGNFEIPRIRTFAAISKRRASMSCEIIDSRIPKLPLAQEAFMI